MSQDIHQIVNKNVNKVSATTGTSCEARGGMFFPRIVDFFAVGHHAQRKPFGSMATILNDKELLRLLNKVIINGEPSCVKSNSYILRMGAIGEFLNSGKGFELSGKKRGIKIQPGHSVAITAFETIDFRRDVVRKIYPDHDLHAIVSPTTDLSREGLVAPTTQVDAGYWRTLNWTITNTSNDVRRFLVCEKLFRLTIFKLAPGETPEKPYQGDYLGKKGLVPSERKGAPAGMKEGDWEDSQIDGGPEALLENLIKSGYPWNLLGERLKIINGQFDTVTTEYGNIKDSLEGVTRDVESLKNDLQGTLTALRRELPPIIDGIVENRTSALHFKWSVAVWAWVAGTVGTVLMVVTSEPALKFLKANGFWIGPVILVLALVAGVINAIWSKKKTL